MHRFREPQNGYHWSSPPRMVGKCDSFQASRPTSDRAVHTWRNNVEGTAGPSPPRGPMVTTNHNSYYNSNGMGNGDIHQVLSPPYAIQNVALDLQPYVLDRGNGQFTRLIPADTLPPLNEVPAREASAVGKVVLQPISPSERRLTLKVSLLLARVLLHIFQRETQHVSPNLGSDEVQHRIDNITGNAPSSKKKRDKIYCDKWVHDGVCAFAQQGCRYKHEMPMDKETQHMMGLYQGLPAWWRKLQGEIPQTEMKGESTSPASPEHPTGLTFAQPGRRATLGSGLGSPVKRQKLGHSMRPILGIGHAQTNDQAPTDVGRFRGSGGGCLESTKRWTADPALTKAGQKGHGRNDGAGHCLWGPIEPPKSSRAGLER
ncbi:hypothetical protein CC79DRAFT_1372901 [Sarocladium strictum]